MTGKQKEDFSTGPFYAFFADRNARGKNSTQGVLNEWSETGLNLSAAGRVM
jgi:hypothetical protein